MEKKKRPWSSPGRPRSAGGNKWATKSPYSMAVGSPRNIPSHEVTTSRKWDWRPRSAGGRVDTMSSQISEVQKIRDERITDDHHWDKTVASYLSRETSVYNLVNQRDELTAQIKRLEMENETRKNESDQAVRTATARLTKDHQAIREEQQHLLDVAESKLCVAEAELSSAGMRVKDGDVANSELRRNIQDLREMKDRSMEAEKFMQGQVQDLTQRSAQLEQDLKEALKLRQETDAQLRAAKEGQLAVEKQHSDAMHTQREEAATERGRLQNQEADLRRRLDTENAYFQNEIENLRKQLESQRRESQESMQKAAEERNKYQDMAATQSAQFSKEMGDLRAEVQTEKSASRRMSTEMKDAQSELTQAEEKEKAKWEKRKEDYSKTIAALREELREGTQNSKADLNDARSELREQQQKIEKLQQEQRLQKDLADQHKKLSEEQQYQAQHVKGMQEKIYYEEMQCRKAKTEAREQAQKIAELEQAVQQRAGSWIQNPDLASQTQDDVSTNRKMSADLMGNVPGKQDSGSGAQEKEKPEFIQAMQARPPSPRPQSRPVSAGGNSNSIPSRPASAMSRESQLQKQKELRELEELGEIESEKPQLAPQAVQRPVSPKPEPKPAPRPKSPVQKAAAPIQKIQRAGCVFWKVELNKANVDEPFGFSQISGKEWALEHEDGPEHLIIGKIMNSGLLHRWNQEHPDAEVIPTDRIVAVNNFTNLPQMLEAQQDTKLEMIICRFPETFELNLSKNGRRFGFTFEKPDGMKEIRITKVLTEGAVPESNKQMIQTLNWHRVVLPEMHVFQVNDVNSDAMALANELRVCETARMHIRRPKEELVDEDLESDPPGSDDQAAAQESSMATQSSPAQQQQQQQQPQQPKASGMFLSKNDFW